MTAIPIVLGIILYIIIGYFVALIGIATVYKEKILRKSSIDFQDDGGFWFVAGLFWPITVLVYTFMVLCHKLTLRKLSLYLLDMFAHLIDKYGEKER